MASRASEYTTRVRYICTRGLLQPEVFCLTKGVEGWWVLAAPAFSMVLKYGLRFSRNWLLAAVGECRVRIPISSRDPLRSVEVDRGLSRVGGGPPGRRRVRVLNPWWVGTGLLNAEEEPPPPTDGGQAKDENSLFRRSVMLAFLANLHHL